MKTANIIAVDLGASSGRIISGQFDGESIRLKEQFRFSNNPVNINERLYWDYLKIFQEIKYGLSIAMKDLRSIDSMSVDTWGVDYGLLTKRGELLFGPHSYRDTRTAPFEEAMLNLITAKRLFKETGNIPAKINTNLQVYSDVERYPFIRDEVDCLLMMPNLIEYFFSGVKKNEFTIASTTGLLDAKTRQWNKSVLYSLGIPQKWFGDVTNGGVDLGPIQKSISEELQVSSKMRVISGVGHDTAAALLALPLTDGDRLSTAFISCGTWSIAGKQTNNPVISDEAFKMGLTNEGCFDGSNRILQNLTGLWIIQELQKEWSYKGEVVSFGKMQTEAENSKKIKSYIDPNDDSFSEPGRMEEKIYDFLKKTNQKLPDTRGQLIRIVIESLALSYKNIINNLEKVTGEKIDTIHMFGGGIQNGLLVQLTADFTKRNVVTGPIEASVMGNIIAQLQVLGKVAAYNRQKILKNSFEVNYYYPSDSPDLEKKYSQFKNILTK